MLLVDPGALSQLLSPGLNQSEWAKIPVACQRASGLARRRLRPGGVHRGSCGGVDPPGQAGVSSAAKRPCRTTSTACAWPRAFYRDRRHDLSCRGRRPPDGQALHRRRRRAVDLRNRATVHRGRQDRERRRLVSFDGLKGEIKLARWLASERDPPGGERPAGAEKSDIYQRFSKLLDVVRQGSPSRHPCQRRPADQAELAYAFGARGIGLCRTEHMFFGEAHR